VAGAAIAINRTQFANARVTGFAAVAPTRASLAAARTARAVPAAAVLRRPIVAATRPPAPVASFAQHQAALGKAPGRPLNERQLRTTAVVAGATAGRATAAHPMAERPNVRVVTQHGAPIRTVAPALPARAAAGARTPPPAAARPNPAAREAVRPVLPAVQRQKPAVEAPRHLDSSRFAHPQGAQPARPANVPARKVPATPAPREEERNNSGGKPRAATNFNGHSITPAPRPEYRAPAAPQRNVQEYRAPAQPRQEYRAPAPQRNVQEYRAPAQPQYRAPPAPQRNVQEFKRPVPQAAPHYNAPQPAQRQREPEKKDDEKKPHGGGRG
jgi:hypothetical protein